MPALLKVGLSFGVILGVNRLRVHLSLGLLAGAVVMGLLMQLPAGGIALAIAGSMLDLQVLSLVAIIAVILTLSRIMSDSGQLDRIVISFNGLIHSTRVVSMVMPSLIGLLPMPGGALFSAPMVGAACRHMDISPETKSAVNYWFRHMWEPCWPLYPGVILAISLLGVEPWKFLAAGIPMSILYGVVGYVMLARAIPGRDAPEKAAPGCNVQANGDWRAFLREVAPILLVVLAVPGVNIFSVLTGISLPSLTSVFVGLGLCLAMVVYQNNVTGRQLLKAVLSRQTLPLVFLVLCIMGFKGVLIESSAVLQIQAEMKEYGIPPLVIIALMPFLTGFITGIAVAFVGASFPLVVPLIADKTGLDYLAYGVLAFNIGLLGEMLSPVHICLLVTRDYFSANLARCYHRILWPSLAVFSAVVFLFAVSRFLI